MTKLKTILKLQKGDINLKMESLTELYKTRSELEEDIKQLGRFGHVHRSGRYMFLYCKKCTGSLLGPKKDEKDCDEEKLDADLIADIEEKITEKPMFAMMLVSINKRTTAIKCPHYEETFLSRMNMENHMKKEHEKENINTDENSEILALVVSIGKAVKEMVKNNIGEKLTQITKAKQPPIWVGQSFDRYKKEVEAWEQSNKNTSITKYQDLLESLKKNKDLKEYVITVILENTVKIEDQTMEKILKSKYSFYNYDLYQVWLI